MQKFVEGLQLQGDECYIVKTGDDFLSEYPIDPLNRMQKIVGFEGSNGIAIFFSAAKAVFITDGRYILQATNTLTNFNVMDFSSTTIAQILKQHSIKKVLLNSKIFSQSFCSNLCKKFVGEEFQIICNQSDERVFDICYDGISEAFAENNCNQAEVYGLTAEEKLSKTKAKMQEAGVDFLLVTNPENICYLLNKRGADNKYTQTKACFMLISAEGACKIYDNQNLYNFTENLPTSAKIGLFDCSFFVYNKILGEGHIPMFLENFVEKWMIIKSEQEVKNIEQTCLLDSKILTNFIKWIKKGGWRGRSEVSLAEELEKQRAKSGFFLHNSFDTISAFGANGAVIHYKPQPHNCSKIEGLGLYLLDSGGQFKYGTTDTTRTISIGRPTKEQKINYTLVLKGHIALACAVFKNGTSGAELDILARQFLYEQGKNYSHGTGHGIGYCLNVHEGKGVGISQGATLPLQPAMLVSNEPGYYKNGAYGIRLENMMLVEKHPLHQNLHQDFLRFRMLTFIPFDKTLIETSLLTKAEKLWLKNYHKKCVC